jgi:hypothetical protein
MHNLLVSVLENSKESSIELRCDMKIFMTNGKYLLGFDLIVPQNDFFTFEKINSLLIDYDDSFEHLIEIVNKPESEYSFSLILK